MARQMAPWRAVQCFVVRLALAAAVLGLPARSLFGISCSVVKHGAPSEASKALLAADLAKAEALDRADLAKTPADEELLGGLIHALLGQQKIQDAAATVKTALAAAPKSAALLTLRGEVELRQGEPWTAEQTVLASYKLDPCNPRTRLLYALIAQLNSRYATARQQLGLAHQFDPEDPEIRAAWLQSLPLDQRIAKTDAYLATPTGDDPQALAQTRADLDRWKKQAAQPVRACRLTSTAASGEVPFIKLLGYAGHTRASGLEMGLNSTTARLQLGAGEGGLSVYRSVAERAGLKRVSETEGPIIPGAKPFYTAYADSIKVGGLEFHDCTLKVIDSGSPFDDGDGLIGIDVFSDFLLTVDYPMRKLQLGPLPAGPQGTPAPVPSLRTDRTSDSGAASAQPTERLIAPEMKDYTQIYRIGNSLILPAALNGDKVKLFILDVGTPETSVAPEIAKQVSKTHEMTPAWGGAKMLVADEINFAFAHMSQKITGVVASDTSMATKSSGMDISGFIGANTFQLLILHVDFRDGLLKFEYIPNRGYKFE